MTKKRIIRIGQKKIVLRFMINMGVFIPVMGELGKEKYQTRFQK